MRLKVLMMTKKRDRRMSRFVVPAVVAVVILAASGMFLARSGRKSVEIVAWDRQVKLVTRRETVADALEQAGILLGPGDSCVPSVEQLLEDDMKIAVSRATAVVVAYDQGVTTVLTSESSVETILALAGIQCGPYDLVIPELDQQVPDSGVLTVVRVAYTEVVEEEEIPFSVDRRDDMSLEAGLTRVVNPGAPGLAKVTYACRIEDGVEVSRQEIGRQEDVAPSPKIVSVGTLREVSRGDDSIRFTEAIEVQATAYCPCVLCCGPSAKGVTHSGLPAEKGVIAVDPRVIPLFSRVYVDGYGYALAADIGSAIKGDRIDVCFDTHDEALRWGRKNVKVYILK